MTRALLPPAAALAASLLIRGSDGLLIPGPRGVGTAVGLRQRAPISSNTWHLRGTPVEIDVKPPKTKDEEVDYSDRRQQWLDRYGSLEALQTTFGSPDDSSSLSPEATRRLYHALLPRSLLAMHEMGLMRPEELAPLAYEARMAAKEYARSRCVWYARMATEMFDYLRAKRRRKGSEFEKQGTKGKGKKRGSGMSWDEIWSKYEAQIVKEECDRLMQKYVKDEKDPEKAERKMQKKLQQLRDDGDLTMAIYLRILEKSCVTNTAFDEMFLDDAAMGEDEGEVLDRMARRMEADVREILLPPKDRQKAEKERKKAEEREAKARQKLDEKKAKLREKLVEKVMMAESKRKTQLRKEGKRISKMNRKLRKEEEKEWRKQGGALETESHQIVDEATTAAKREAQAMRVLMSIRKLRGRRRLRNLDSSEGD
ncbi:hypothetical protein ACHAXT_001824 [Thalassiosira profunda]